VFFAIAQEAGAIGPVFYGALIGDGTNRGMLAVGYVIGAAIMMLGGLVEMFIGVDAEGKSLETVARPLTAVNEGWPGYPAPRVGRLSSTRSRCGSTVYFGSLAEVTPPS
jgi:hypothetical protein